MKEVRDSRETEREALKNAKREYKQKYGNETPNVTKLRYLKMKQLL